jgi:hypothetical protein
MEEMEGEAFRLTSAAPCHQTTRPMNELEIDTPDVQFKRVTSDLAKLFHDRQVTLFSGAGVSVPSGLPDSGTMVESITSSMLRAIDHFSLCTTDERELVRSTISKRRLEPILDSIVQFHEESSLNSILNFSCTEPNYNHESVAQLAAHRYLSHIITLNFDVLFETSLETYKVPFSWNLPLANYYELAPGTDPRVKVTKPHGTLPFGDKPYKDYYLAATLEQVGDHPQDETSKAIATIAEESPVLFVCGYSNNDWDILPILTATRWSRIYWIQHSHDLRPSVRSWLETLGRDSYCLLYGDVRLLFNHLLKALEISDAAPRINNIRTIVFDASQLDANPAATAFAAVNLLGGIENELYRSLLEKLGRSKEFLREPRLIETWERTMAWVHHVFEGKPHKAIRRYRRVIPPTTSLPHNHMGRLNDCRSMHYEHISSLKRPYKNPLLLHDILWAARWRRELFSRVATIQSSKDSNPFVIRQSAEIKAILEYDRVDLRHNWAYHLLPFPHKTLGRVARILKTIAREYYRLANKHPDMDWEYRFVRRVEAHLLADDELTPVTMRKLMMVRDMFEQTGKVGHLINADSMIAIAKGDYHAFLQSKERMLDLRRESSPSGKLRIVLMERYFWPEKLSFWSALKSLVLR